MRATLFSLLAVSLLAPALWATGAQAQGAQISVEMDKARTLRLAEPAATVIVGNPLVADAGIQDSRTLIITGKSFGLTNLIALDAEGRTILSADLVVTEANAPQTALISLYRGTARSSYACAAGGACQGQPMIGDSPATYDALSQQRAAQLAASNAEAGN